MTAERPDPVALAASESALHSVAEILAAGLVRLSTASAQKGDGVFINPPKSSPIRLAIPSDLPLSVRPTGQRPVRGHTKEVTAP